MADLLIELFSEEIPARMQTRARADLKALVTQGLVDAGLTYAGAGAHSTPRRLTLAIEGLSDHSAATREERKGPATTAAPAAIEGFLRSTGLTQDQLQIRDDKKGQTYFAVIEKAGRPAAPIIAEVLESTIRNFPWPKSMRWGSGNLRWVRPLHSILCILSNEAGAEIVPLTVDGITAGNTTAGHRFLAPARFSVTSFDDYAAKLARAHVILDSEARAQTIWQGAQNLAFAAGLEVVADAALLAEVAGLVEWPVPLLGRIDDAFLGLPAEVLQTSMREHQKFFSARNPKTGRIEGFVTVANIEPADHGAMILKGNQKVLTARLSDARFFWENDLRVAKSGMTEWLDALDSVTFHNKLGSQKARIERIAALAREIAPMVGADPEVAARAARLAKADLRSAMVGEFPELQGVMGRYYALAAGESEAVANAARDHYSPLGPTDAVPTDPVSVAVALADKIDTLTGFWWINEKPTGSKDPFALRRAALGVIRLVLGNGVRTPLSVVSYMSAKKHAQFAVLEQMISETPTAKVNEFTEILAQLDDEREATEDNLRNQMTRRGAAITAADVTLSLLRQRDGFRALVELPVDLLSFFHDRLKVFLKDQGIRPDIIEACLAMPNNDDLTLLVKRAEALAAFLKSDDGTNLLQGVKRATNILSQAEAKDGVEYSFGADIKFAETDSERALFAALDTAESQITPAMKSEDFAAAMTAMAALRAPIDAFFTDVQVNADSEILRRNRLNLLHRIRALCAGVADFSKLEG
jgi:glycyl-tRNA synthetase beta chain